jgi:basic membrane protein A
MSDRGKKMKEKEISTVALAVIVVSCVIVSIIGTYLATRPGEELPPGEEEEEEEEEEEKLKVALLLTDVITDISWSGPAYNSLLEIAEDLPIEVSYSEQCGVADAERVIREYIEDGYKIIFAHTYDYSGTVAHLMAENPDVILSGTISVEDATPNVAMATLDLRPGNYLMGIVAGYLTETNKIGFVMPYPGPDWEAERDSMFQGARSVNPEIETSFAVNFSFVDIPNAKEITHSMIDEGCDFVYVKGGACVGAMRACEETGKGYTFGSQADMHSIAPEVVVTSVVWNPEVAYRTIIEDYLADGEVKNMYYLGFAEGAVYLAPWYGWEDRIPQELDDLLEEAMEDMLAGKITLPKGPMVELVISLQPDAIIP